MIGLVVIMGLTELVAEAKRHADARAVEGSPKFQPTGEITVLRAAANHEGFDRKLW